MKAVIHSRYGNSDVLQVTTLEQAADAMRTLVSGQVRGKLVLRVAASGQP